MEFLELFMGLSFFLAQSLDMRYSKGCEPLLTFLWLLGASMYYQKLRLHPASQMNLLASSPQMTHSARLA